MVKLILLRHLKSQWNLENRFTGWVDIPIIKKRFKIPQLDFDIVYTSSLIRNIQTVLLIFQKKKEYPIFRHFDGKMKKWGNFNYWTKNKNTHEPYIFVYVTEKLNERYYGKLQGLNKEDTIKKYGKEKVKVWRRSYDVAPPGGESLKDVINRVIPFYKKYPEQDLKKGKNVLIVASHNSLRAIVKYIEGIDDQEIINFELPFNGKRIYNFIKGKYILNSS